MGYDVVGRTIIGRGFQGDTEREDRLVDIKDIGKVDQLPNGTATFRSAGWAWGDILDAVFSTDPDVSSKICIPWTYDGEEIIELEVDPEMCWGTNDGLGLTEQDCLDLAPKLKAVIESARSASVGDKDTQEKLDHLEEFASFLQVCGGFRIF